MTKLTPQENSTKTRRSRAGKALGLVPVRLWVHPDWITDGGVVSVLKSSAGMAEMWGKKSPAGANSTAGRVAVKGTNKSRDNS